MPLISQDFMLKSVKIQMFLEYTFTLVCYMNMSNCKKKKEEQES